MRLFKLAVLSAALLANLAPAQSLPRETRQRILEAVVQIVPFDPASNQLVDWSGSGTIISPDGYILTNFHVIGDEATREHYQWHAVFTTLPSAPDQPPRLTYWARYVASDATHDLALIKIVEYHDETPVPPTVRFTAMPVGDSNLLLPGDPLFVVGYPGIAGSTITFTSGIMSGWLGEDLEAGGKQWIKTDAKIARGNSGGAAFDENGYLIGVPTALLQSTEGGVFEEQFYLRPISLAWAIIGPHVANVQRAPGVQVQQPVAQPTTQPSPGTAPVTGAGQPSGNYGAISIGASRSNIVAAATAETLVYHTYTVAVPAGLASLTISVDGKGSDLDLAARFGTEITSYRTKEEGGDWDFLDLSAVPNPSFTYSNPPAGTLYIDVINVITQPSAYTVSVTTGPGHPPAPAQPAGTVTANTAQSAVIGALPLGQSAQGQLAGMADSASFHTYYVEVPAGVAQLTITMSADIDLDLAVKFGSEIISYADREEGGDWLYRDNSATPGAQFSIPNPQPGRWYIDVFNALGPGQTGRYTLSVR
ncbi:MAG: trypsin-like peptidase domain-containing protein [Truepera sp.]|nr:trypsin-like peptidase domain-containing protein [Truepera sp.]